MGRVFQRDTSVLVLAVIADILALQAAVDAYYQECACGHF